MYAGLIGTAVHVVLGRGIAIAACTPRTNLLRTAHEGKNYFGRLHWGLGIAAKGKKKAKRRAVVAVARKLAVLLHRLWVSGDRYYPRRSERPTAVAA